MEKGIRGKQIMVVDDESDVTVFRKISLEYYGYVVDTFNDPKEALSNFKLDCYDLVILDIKMPEMDGFELYKKIREIDPTVKACFLTASELYHEEFRNTDCKSLSKELFIRKPVENSELIEKITRFISK